MTHVPTCFLEHIDDKTFAKLRESIVLLRRWYRSRGANKNTVRNIVYVRSSWIWPSKSQYSQLNVMKTKTIYITLHMHWPLDYGVWMLQDFSLVLSKACSSSYLVHKFYLKKIFKCKKTRAPWYDHYSVWRWKNTDCPIIAWKSSIKNNTTDIDIIWNSGKFMAARFSWDKIYSQHS